DARGFDDDMVEPVRLREQLEQGLDQRIADRAAQAPVGERDRVAAVGCDQLAVDVERAEIIDQHCESPPRRTGQQPVEQGRLARAEEPTDDGERDHGCGRATPVARLLMLLWTASLRLAS